MTELRFHCDSGKTTTIEVYNVPDARAIINKHLPEYIDEEYEMMRYVFDLTTNDGDMPVVTRYSILVDGEIVWTNN